MPKCTKSNPEWRLKCAGRRLLWAGNRWCCPVCAWENMKLWRGSCFDVQSSIRRKPCPAKIGLWGSYGSLGSQPVGRQVPLGAHPCQKNGRGWARAPAVPGRPFFSLVSTSRHWPESRDHRRQNYSRVLPATPELLPPQQLRSGGPPQCFSPQLSIRSSRSRHMTKAIHTHC